MKINVRLWQNYTGASADSTFKGRICWQRAVLIVERSLPIYYLVSTILKNIRLAIPAASGRGILDELVISGTIPAMSFLFHKKTKVVIKWIWGVIAVLIILSMIFVYSGGSGLF